MPLNTDSVAPPPSAYSLRNVSSAAPGRGARRWRSRLHSSRQVSRRRTRAAASSANSCTALSAAAAPSAGSPPTSVRTSSRIDAPGAERLDDGDAVVAVVLGHEVEVGGDQRPQVVAEGDVDRRAVVDGADAHQEQCRAAFAASCARRSTRSGWRSPSGSTPVPPVAMRSRSPVRFGRWRGRRRTRRRPGTRRGRAARPRRRTPAGRACAAPTCRPRPCRTRRATPSAAPVALPNWMASCPAASRCRGRRGRARSGGAGPRDR